MEYLSLFELNSMIRETLETQMEPSYWVVAEIGELRVNRSGHCYLDLVEKNDEALIAKMRGTIWSYTYRKLMGWFEAITGQTLQPGMQILAHVEVQFHEAYGISLNIRDIDANYTLGERARRKQEILQQLADEGVLEMNKTLALPLVPQHIAVISSPTAAGYGDFMNQLANNRYGYNFHVHLFQALMQGTEAKNSIIDALYKVYQAWENGAAYDALVIIRGGGAQVDLDCFDTYDLAAHIAQFPLPVITGIGHERDETIADLVAHTRMKTPTAVAEFLITGVLSFEEALEDRFDRISRMATAVLQEASFRLERIEQQVQYTSRNALNQAHQNMEWLYGQLQYATKIQLSVGKERLKKLEETLCKQPFYLIEKQKDKLQGLEKNLNLLNPQTVLKRGYTITYINDIPFTDKISAKPGDTVTTFTHNKSLKSKVVETSATADKVG